MDSMSTCSISKPQLWLQSLSPSAAIVTIGVFVLSIITFQQWRRTSNPGQLQQRRATGPRSWPLVGSAWELGRNYHRMHDWLLLYFEGCSTISLPMPGGQMFYYTVDTENVKYMLKTNFRNFPKGEDFHEQMEVLLGDGIFNTDGEKWKRQRKTASAEFSMRSLRDYNAVVFKEKALILARLLLQIEQQGVHIDMQDLFMRMTLDSIGTVGFGVEIGSLPSQLPLPNNAFAKAFDTVNEIVTRRFVDPLWRLKRALRIGREDELGRSMEVLDKFTYNVIDRRKFELAQDASSDTRSSPVVPLKLDLITRFLLEPSSTSEGDREKVTLYKKTKILRDNVLNFVIAGRDTTAVTLSWFLYSLIEKPEVAERLYDELIAFERTRTESLGHHKFYATDELKGADCEYFYKIQDFSKLLTLDSLKAEDLPYLQATITETLRLFPAVPLDPKGILKDDVLPDGTRLKKGGMISYSAYCMARASSIWGQDAREFKPDRWLHDGKFQTESEFKFTTFQAGPRTCLGKDSAYLQLRMTAAILCRFFQFHIVPGHKVRYRMMSTLSMDCGLQVFINRRQSSRNTA